MKGKLVPVRAVVFVVGALCLGLACDFVGGGTSEETESEAGSAVEETWRPPERGERGGKVVACPNSEPAAYVTSKEVLPVRPVAEPAPLAPFRDPTFGACLVRVTDRQHDLPPDDPSLGLKNEYSRVQAFSPDGRTILVRSIEANWYLYDASTLQPLGRLPLEVDPRWVPGDPGRIYHSDGTRLMAYDLESGEQAMVHDFADDFPGVSLAAVWTRYEGSPSMDGRYWGLMAQDEAWEAIALLIYDREEDRVIARRQLPRSMSIDAVTISPLGNYLLVYHDDYCQPGETGDENAPCGLMVYDRDLQHGRSLLRIVGHSDTALDGQGREALVYQDIDADNLSMLDLASGEITALWPIDFSHSPIGFHFSGRGFDRPGWVVVSTYSGARPSATWMDDQVFALELKPGGWIVRLAHTHSVVDEDQEHDYWAEPQATVNPDFTRVLFTSNWGRSGSEEVEMMMIILPGNWLDSVAQTANP